MPRHQHFSEHVSFRLALIGVHAHAVSDIHCR
ncbi:Ms4533A family Cys-rich leader peptide [Streptomyces sp. ODS28]